MNNSEEFLIFKNFLFATFMWALCLVGCACIGLHIIDDSYHLYDIPPLVILGSRSVTYFWGGIQYHKLLKTVKDINRRDKLE